MSTNKTGLMNHYVNGSIIGREMRQMFYNNADIERFDRDMPSELDFLPGGGFNRARPNYGVRK